MRVLRHIVEAYRRPLLEVSRLTHTPIHGEQVRCPFDGLAVSTTDCTRCPRYVRTQVFETGDGFWSQRVVSCDPQAFAPCREVTGSTSN